MAHIYGCLVKSRKFLTIDVKELLDSETRKPVSNERIAVLLKCKHEKLPTSKEQYWFEDDQNNVHRVIIYDIAASLKELTVKVNASGTRVKFPSRKSMGDLVVPADDFFKGNEHRSCEEEKSQKEEARNTVKANREESIMKSIACTSSSTLEVKSTKEVKLKEPKPSKPKKLDEIGTDCGNVQKTPSNSSKNSPKSHTSENKKKEERNARKKSNSRSTSITDADQSGSWDESFKSADKVKDVKSDHPEKQQNMFNNAVETVKSGGEELIPKESDINDNLKVLPHIDNSEFMTNDVFDQSVSLEEELVNYRKRISSTPLKTSEEKRMKAECTNGDCISTREALIEENDTLKKRIQELELQLGEKSNTKRIVQDLQSKLGTLCNALETDESSSNKTGDKEQRKKKKICPILLATRVDPEESDDESDEVEIPEGQIYLGIWNGVQRFASKSQLGKLDKIHVYSKRLIGVILIVWGDEDATTYSFRGSNEVGNVKHKVQVFHTNAVYRLLKLLSWKGCHLKPLKINATHVEPLSKKYVERTLQRMLVSDNLQKAVQQLKPTTEGSTEESSEVACTSEQSTMDVSELLDKSISSLDESMELPKI